jgi:uncharacterized membrane protein
MTAPKKFDTQKLVLLALLTAMVVVLQLLAIAARPLFPLFTITLVLVPIVIGAALCGRAAGAWLGLMFGLAVLASGDAAAFLAINPGGTVLTVLGKGALAGLAAGAIYRFWEDENKTLAVVFAAVACPLVNTALFAVGAYAFFLPTISLWAQGAGYENATLFIFFGMIGINFIVELGINVVLCPVIIRLIDYGKKMRAQ